MVRSEAVMVHVAVVGSVVFAKLLVALLMFEVVMGRLVWWSVKM